MIVLVPTLHFVRRVGHHSIGGSVVEFSPATREARVRFPANASFYFLSKRFATFLLK